jgi:metal-dependent amidase/aminoacylase/carboxypeptidase family protein
VDVLDVKFYGKSAHASENADEALNALDANLKSHHAHVDLF